MRRISIAGAAILGAVLATPLGAATTYTYDSLGRLSIVNYDDGLQTIYNYDSAGNRTSITTQSGSTLPLVANNDYITVAENANNQGYAIPPSDTDPQGYSLHVSAVGSASWGSTSYSGATMYYKPNLNYLGPDSFTYTIADNYGGSASATVFVTVTKVGPVANSDNESTPENTQLIYNPMANDTEPNPPGYQLIISSAGPASHGTVSTVNSGAQLQYMPANGYTGNDSFPYTISDQHGLTSTATDTITIGSPPVAVADYVPTPAGTAVKYSPLVNDTDPNNYQLSIVSTTTPSHGGVVINGDGTVTYTPNAGYTGVDTFQYTISDGHGLTASAQDNVCIGSVLTANNDTVYLSQNFPYDFIPNKSWDPRANDTDGCGATFTVTSVNTQPQTGGASVDTGGVSVHYTWEATLSDTNKTAVGTETFQYTITDLYGLTSSATVTVHVNSSYSGY